MEKAEFIIRDMHREVRTVAFNLMPQTLIQNGLVPALQEMIMSPNESGKIKIEILSFQIPNRMGEVKEISLYQILREWVTNVMKYAKASKITINLVDNEESISITADDDGEGFNTADLESTQRNGCKNIQSRLNLLKGSLEIDSMKGRQGRTLLLNISKEFSPVTG